MLNQIYQSPLPGLPSLLTRLQGSSLARDLSTSTYLGNIPERARPHLRLAPRMRSPRRPPFQPRLLAANRWAVNAAAHGSKAMSQSAAIHCNPVIGCRRVRGSATLLRCRPVTQAPVLAQVSACSSRLPSLSSPSPRQTGEDRGPTTVRRRRSLLACRPRGNFLGRQLGPRTAALDQAPAAAQVSSCRHPVPACRLFLQHVSASRGALPRLHQRQAQDCRSEDLRNNPPRRPPEVGLAEGRLRTSCCHPRRRLCRRSRRRGWRLEARRRRLRQATTGHRQSLKDFSMAWSRRRRRRMHAQRLGAKGFKTLKSTGRRQNLHGHAARILALAPARAWATRRRARGASAASVRCACLSPRSNANGLHV